jgi:hypothetical protein
MSRENGVRLATKTNGVVMQPLPTVEDVADCELSANVRDRRFPETRVWESPPLPDSDRTNGRSTGRL